MDPLAYARRNLASCVAEEIEKLLFSGAIAPGERINESHLASDLRVSRAPIREACRLLERHGLVRMEPNRGTFVCQLSPAEIADLYDIRATLEGLIGERAAQVDDPTLLAELQALLGELRSALAAADATAYFQANSRFHRRILAATGSAYLSDIYDSIAKRIALHRIVHTAPPATMKASLAEHRRILAALEARDPLVARQTMAEHCRNGYRRFLAEQAAAGSER